MKSNLYYNAFLSLLVINLVLLSSAGIVLAKGGSSGGGSGGGSGSGSGSGDGTPGMSGGGYGSYGSYGSHGGGSEGDRSFGESHLFIISTLGLVLHLLFY
jgi:hypothetical protein